MLVKDNMQVRVSEVAYCFGPMKYQLPFDLSLSKAVESIHISTSSMRTDFNCYRARLLAVFILHFYPLLIHDKFD